MSRHETMETRSGEFDLNLPGSSYDKSLDAIQDGLDDGDYMWVSETVSGTEVYEKDVTRLANKIDELMSGPDEEVAKWMDSEKYFRDITGLIGYELGSSLDEDAGAEDIERIAEDIYGELSLKEHGKFSNLVSLTKNGFSEVSLDVDHHTHEEVKNHLEDAMWIGYRESNS